MDIKLYKPFNGKKAFRGELLGLIDGKIVIKDENDDEISFDRKDAGAVRLAIIF